MSANSLISALAYQRRGCPCAFHEGLAEHMVAANEDQTAG